MAIAEHTTFATALSAPFAAFTRATGVAASAYRAWSNRKQFRRLLDMSDWELADIGLERSDLYDALSNREGFEPTGYLNVMARPRRTLESAARRVS